jgi:hypothetical protein
MELVNRYLNAVRFWLPRELKEDISGELGEDIRAQIEEREAELGRRLESSEVAAILKHYGRPVLVAGRYLPQRYLIGPALFSVYELVLKIIALCYLVPWVLMWIALLTTSPGYRAHLGLATLADWESLWVITISAFGTATLVFAFLERVGVAEKLGTEWDPRKLPRVRNSRQVPRVSSAFDFAINLVFAVWTADVLRTGTLLDRPEVRVALTPASALFVRIVFLLVFSAMLIAAVNLVRPSWTTVRKGMHALINLAGAAALVLLSRADEFVTISGVDVTADKVVRIMPIASLWISRGLLIAAAAMLVAATVEGVQALRLRTTWCQRQAALL